VADEGMTALDDYLAATRKIEMPEPFHAVGQR